MPAVFVVRAIALGLALLGFGIALKTHTKKEPEKETAPKKSPLPKKEKLDAKPKEKNEVSETGDKEGTDNIVNSDSDSDADKSDINVVK